MPDHGADVAAVLAAVLQDIPLYAIEATSVPECSHMLSEEGTYCLRCGKQATP